MTRCIKHRLAALGLALSLLLLAGCQSGGGAVLTLPGGTDPVPGVEWQTLLFNEVDRQSGGKAFQRDDDALAEQLLECVRELARNDAAAASQLLTEDRDDGYATGAKDIRTKLSLPKNDKTRMVGYAVVPQEQTGSVELWDTKALAGKLIKSSCCISLNEAQPTTEVVGFAAGDIGGRTFVLAVFQ